MTTASANIIQPKKNLTKTKGEPQEIEQSVNDRVVQVVKQLAATMNAAIGEIREINENAKLLSLNARIEAARAGASGAAFGVVAQEMQALSNNTANVADDMANKTQRSIEELIGIIGGNVRGARLADIALNSIDLIDRNLYERTCDVRWWATDSAIVDALENPNDTTADYAARRMGVILNAYTVYFDLVLCDITGRIIANGRPNHYASIGRNESKALWFTRAMATRNGNEFAFQSAHHSELVGNQPALIYSSTVRRNGEANESVLGVLGVVFNWSALANAVLANASLDQVESQKTIRLLMDRDQNILASSRALQPGFRLQQATLDTIFRSNKGYCHDDLDGKQVCIGHAKSPGFETYATGWYSILIQETTS